MAARKYDGRMWRAVILIAALALASGCVSVVSIDAEDTTQFAHFEASAPLDDSDRLRLQLRASSSDGEFTQQLDPGERIEIGDDSIFGPTRVAGDLELVYYSIALGFTMPDLELDSGQLRFTYYFGIAQTELDLRLVDGPRRFDERDGTTEFYFQAALDYRAGDRLNLGLAWAGSLGPGLSGIGEVDLELTYRLAGMLRVGGGYRWLEYIYAEKDDDSHIEVDFRGPFFAIALALD